MNEFSINYGKIIFHLMISKHFQNTSLLPPQYPAFQLDKKFVK